MDAKVITQDLIKTLAQINQMPKKRTILPVTDCIHMDFSDGHLTIRFTDLQETVQATMGAKVDKPFQLVLPRGTVTKFVNACTTESSLSFTAGGTADHPSAILGQMNVGKMTIQGAVPAHFPTVNPPPADLTWYSIDSKWFCRLLSIVSTGCAPDQSRPVLTGVSFQDGALASADGFRLYVVKSSKLQFGLGKAGIIVPKEAVAIIVKLFSKEETLMVGTLPNRNFAWFKSKNVLFTVALTQGAFPQYQQLIPQTFSSKVTVSVPLMLQRLDMIDSEELSSGIIRLFTTNKDVLNIHARSEEMMDYDLTMPAKIEGEDSKIALNIKYLVDSIKPFSLCHLEISNPSSPVKVTGDIEELMCVTMPMFTTW